MRLLEQPQPFASAIACGLSRFAFLKRRPGDAFRRDVRDVEIYAKPGDLGTLGGAVGRGLAACGLQVIQDLPRGLIVARARLHTVRQWSTLAGRAQLRLALTFLPRRRPIDSLSEAEAELFGAAERHGWDCALELVEVERVEPPLTVREADRFGRPRRSA